MSIKTKSIGDFGEDQARKFLINSGYKIIQKNYRVLGIGEIDILSEESGYLVIIEVKKRNNRNYLSLDSITHSKKEKLFKTAECFIAENYDKYNEWPIRFDLVLIDGQSLKLMKDVFV